jgi:hypothetical protein
MPTFVTNVCSSSANCWGSRPAGQDHSNRVRGRARRRGLICDLWLNRSQSRKNEPTVPAPWSCGGPTVLSEEVTVSLGPLLSRVGQPSQMRLASLRRSIKNASMADLAQSEVKTEV